MQEDRQGRLNMARDVYNDAGVVQGKTSSGTMWLEIKKPTHITQNGQGLFYFNEDSYMVIPSSSEPGIRCFANMYVYIRVNEDLVTQIKLLPAEVEDGYRGIYFNQLACGTSQYIESYPSVMVVHPKKFTLSNIQSESGMTFNVTGTSVSVSGVPNAGVSQGNGAYRDESSGMTAFRRTTGKKNAYGRSRYRPKAFRTYNWEPGYGGMCDYVDRESRWANSEQTKLTSEWINSKAWTTIGNLGKDFVWSSDLTDYTGWIYMCGSAYYSGKTVEQSSTAYSKQITIPGLKRLLNYYPWAIRKGSEYYSCNRDGGHLKSRKSGWYINRKNRPD